MFRPIFAFPLSEETGVINSSYDSWIPALVGVGMFVIFLIVIILRKHISKKHIISNQMNKQSISDFRKQALHEIENLLNEISEGKKSNRLYAEKLSKICRTFVDNILMSRSLSMSLNELKRAKLAAWLDEVIADCYQYEFSQKNNQASDELSALASRAYKEINEWK